MFRTLPRDGDAAPCQSAGQASGLMWETPLTVVSFTRFVAGVPDRQAPFRWGRHRSTSNTSKRRWIRTILTSDDRRRSRDWSSDSVVHPPNQALSRGRSVPVVDTGRASEPRAYFLRNDAY